MGNILAIVASVISAGVLLLRWYLSARNTKLREFRNDEKARDKFMGMVDRGDMSNARRAWLLQVRVNRARRRDDVADL